MKRVDLNQRNEKGAATAELAASIPLLVFVTLLLMQTAAVMVDQLAVMQAAREAARTAAVSSSHSAVRSAAQQATNLNPSKLDVQIGERGSPGELVEVVVRYKSRIRVPLTQATLLEPIVSSRAAMSVET